MNSYNYKDLSKIDTLVGELGELWLFDTTPGDYHYKCYSDNRELQRQFLGWEGAKKGATYYRQDGVLITYDVIIPKRLVKRACRVYKILLKKDPKQVARGKLLNEKYPGDRFSVSSASVS